MFTKKAFIFYGRKNYVATWTSDNFYDGIRTESRNLKEYLQGSPIAGLILTGIDDPLNEVYFIDYIEYK